MVSSFIEYRSVDQLENIIESIEEEIWVGPYSVFELQRLLFVATKLMESIFLAATPVEELHGRLLESDESSLELELTAISDNFEVSDSDGEEYFV